MKLNASAARSFLFLWLFFPSTSKSTSPEKEAGSVNYNCVHQPTNNVYGGSVTSNINVNLQAVLSQIQKQAVKVSIAMQTKISNVIDITTRTAQQHWQKLIMFAVAGGYFWLLWRIYRAKQWLTSPSLWASWLMSREVRFLSDSDLQRQLMQEIAIRYINPDDPTDRLYPLVLFYADIEKEIEILHGYSNWFYRLHTTYAHRAIPMHVPSAEEVRGLIDRSEYVRSLFRLWIAQQNVQIYFDQYADIMHERGLISRRYVVSAEYGI